MFVTYSFDTKKLNSVIVLFFIFLGLYAQFPPEKTNYNELIIDSKGKSKEVLIAKLQLGYYYVYKGINLDFTLFYINFLDKKSNELDQR